MSTSLALAITAAPIGPTCTSERAASPNCDPTASISADIDTPCAIQKSLQPANDSSETRARILATATPATPPFDFPYEGLYDPTSPPWWSRVVQAAAVREAAYVSGEDLAGGETGESKVLADLVNPYLRERVRRQEMTKDTARNNHTALSQFAALYGRRPVANLSRRDVERWLEKYGYLAAGTRRSRFSMLRCWFDWLVDRGHIKRSPVYGMKPPKKAKAMKRALPFDDVQCALDAAEDQRARLIAVLMLQLGLRAMEVARLELGDIDLRERILIVRRGKGGKQRALYVTDEALSELLVFLGMFPSNGGPLIRSYQFPTQALTPGTIGNICRRMLYDAGVKKRPRDGISGHAFRHTCATDMLRNGAPIRDVQATLGHSSISTTEDYLPLLAGTLSSAMEGRHYATPGVRAMLGACEAPERDAQAHRATGTDGE